MKFADVSIFEYLNNEYIFKKFSSLVIFIFLWIVDIDAQDIHFSQLSQTQNFANPAFTGIQFGPRIIVNYRNQFPKVGEEVNGGFNTIYASYDQFINSYNSGVGIQAISEKFSDNIFSRYHINLNYAYQARFDEQSAIRFGLTGNFIVQQLDRTKLHFFDQIDPIFGFDNFIPTQENLLDNYSQSYFNFNAGALYYRSNIYLGLSARNILPKKNFYNSSRSQFEDLLISAQAGGVIWTNREQKSGIFPYLLYERQYNNSKLVANFIYQYKLLNLGLGFRHSMSSLESMILMLGVNLNKIRFSYSYDIASGGLSSYSGGSHEVGLKILFKGEDNSVHPNEFSNISFCPEFIW